MALGITASAMAAPTAIDEKEVPPAEVTMARLHAAPGMSLAILSLILIMIPCIKAAMVLMILLAMAAAVVKCN